MVCCHMTRQVPSGRGLRCQVTGEAGSKCCPGRSQQAISVAGWKRGHDFHCGFIRIERAKWKELYRSWEAIRGAIGRKSTPIKSSMGQGRWWWDEARLDGPNQNDSGLWSPDGLPTGLQSRGILSPPPPPRHVGKLCQRKYRKINL